MPRYESRSAAPRRLRRWVGRTLLVLALAPAFPILIFRWVPPPTTAFMLEARVFGLNDRPPCRSISYRWIGWEGISPSAKLAVIASEDQRFAEHWGFDFASIGNALQTSVNGGRLRGASTISQQVAKNLFLWSGHSWVRKAIEAYVVVWIELLWPKKRILEVYLNIMQLGHCTFGVDAAARQFFRQSPASLGAHQAALLAAVLPNPVALSATNPSDYVEDRAQWIESQIRQLGGARYLDRL